MSDARRIETLAWDSAQFGLRVGSLDLDQPGSREALPEEARDFDLVYARTTSGVALDASLLDPLHGVLADRRVTFVRHANEGVGAEARLKKLPGEVHSVHEKDALAAPLVELAPQAAKYSRFTADPNFPGEWTAALYRTWMHNSLSRERASDVLAYVEADHALGFYTVRVAGDRANLELFAVDAPERGRGIGGALLAAGLAWCRAQGIARSSVTTQEENPACALYRAFHYTEHSRESIYHLWPGGGPADPASHGR